MAGIYSSPYPIEKIGDSPYPYPYPVNAGILRQNGDGFGQYPRGRVYLSSLQPAHSHQQHSPTRATTQRFLVFIRYAEPQLKGSHSRPQPIECHVLNPYPEPQLKDTFWATTHGTPASSPSRYLRSLIDHATPFKLQSNQYCKIYCF